LTHSLTLVNWFGSGGTGRGTGWFCEGMFDDGKVVRVKKRDISTGFVSHMRML